MHKIHELIHLALLCRAGPAGRFVQQTCKTKKVLKYNEMREPFVDSL